MDIHRGCQAVTDALRSPEELEHTSHHVLHPLEDRGYRLQQRIAAHRGPETLDAYGASASYLVEAAAIFQGTVAVLRSLHGTCPVDPVWIARSSRCSLSRLAYAA